MNLLLIILRILVILDENMKRGDIENIIVKYVKYKSLKLKNDTGSSPSLNQRNVTSILDDVEAKTITKTLCCVYIDCLYFCLSFILRKVS